jgi:hypothetical protein
MGFLIRVPIHFDYPGLNARPVVAGSDSRSAQDFSLPRSMRVSTFTIALFLCTTATESLLFLLYIRMFRQITARADVQ